MTDAEQNILHELSQDVKETKESVSQMNLALVKHVASEESCKHRVEALHLEMFGMDADPNRPGIKRRMDRNEWVVESITKKAERVWNIVAALLGAAGMAVIRHFFP
jgi:hypothetical protein